MEWTGPLRWSESGAGPAGESGDVAADPAAWGDVIVGRKETPTSYHLSVVVDDALQGVTDVVRGQDLFWSTSVHRVLQALLDLPAPNYHHHRLILDADGKKLSKSTRGHRPARVARAGHDARRYSQTCERRGVVPAAPAWHVSRRGLHGEGQAQGSTRKARKRRRPPARRSRAIEVALAGLAHDIRTPLTGILALSQLLQASDLPERERGWAEAIRGAADHLARLTTLVVDAAKADATGLVLRRRAVLAARAGAFGGGIARGARARQGARRRHRYRQGPARPRQRRRGAAAQRAGKSGRQRGEVHRARQHRLCRVVGALPGAGACG